MFLKCAQCAYLTPEASTTCKQCGGDPLAGRTATAETPAPPSPPAPARPTSPPVESPSVEAQPIGEPFAAAVTPSPPPTWPPATTPARPMNIFDVPPPPGAPPTGPPGGPAIPAMFPQPGARPPKHSVAVTILGVVAIAVVLALVIGAAFGRSSSTSAQPVATTPPSPGATVDTWTMREALPSGDALGPGWTVIGHQDLEPYSLVWDETCWSNPGLESVAQGGTSVDQGLAVDAAGNDQGETNAWIKQYETSAEVDGQLTARLDPQYGACAAEFARNDLACSCKGKTATDTTLTPVAAPAGVRAAVYRTELHYVDEQGNSRPFSDVHAYVAAGRWLGSFRVYRFDTPVDQQWFDQQLTAFAQQLALRAPT